MLRTIDRTKSSTFAATACIAATGAVLTSAPASAQPADIVYEQPFGLAGVTSPTGRARADSFTLPEDTPIGAVRFGLFGGLNPSLTSVEIVITPFDDDSTMNPPAYTETFAVADFITEPMPGAPSSLIAEVRLSTPFIARGGQGYMIEFRDAPGVQTLGVASSGGDGKRYEIITADGSVITISGVDLAFALRSERFIPVVETPLGSPLMTAAAALALATGGALLLRRRLSPA
jgi:hypothetical protein